MFKPEPGRRYDMPAVFGPSELRDQATFGETRVVTHSFLTERDALEPLIPYHFRLVEPAKVIIGGHMQIDVDWLGGRNYHIVRAAAEVEFSHGGTLLRGLYSLVVWESDPRPVIAGREFQGIAKIFGEIPEHERTEHSAAFECFEYGTRLLRVDVAGLKPAGDDAVARLNAAGDRVAFGWKYIAGPDGTVDADYPVKQVSRSKVQSAWTGESSVTFDQPTWEQAPTSARIVRTLAALPVIDVLPSMITHSRNGVLDRRATTRLC